MQEFINKNFYYLFFITLLFGVIFYGLIGFQLIDEICGLILFIMFIFQMFKTKSWEINKVFAYVLLIFLFYIFYSIYIKSNSISGILFDCTVQIKPYLAFFCVYQLRPLFSKQQKTILRQSSVVLWFLLLPIGLGGIFMEKIFTITMAHASNFASAVFALAAIYLYTSENTKKDRLIFICMLALGLVSGRAKFYGFFVLAAFVALYFSNAKNLKLNLKNSIILLSMVAIIIFVAKDKISLYFLQGISDDADKDLVARFALYATSGSILMDYMPFGSGFASFATHASGVFYSPIYTEYGIDGVWGLSKTFKSFISDTYYPSLAQFGFVGIILFISFWFYLIRKAYLYFIKTNNTHYMILAIIIVGYFAIENIADATFTSNRGLFFMMFLGLIFSDMKYEYKSQESLN